MDWKHLSIDVTSVWHMVGAKISSLAILMKTETRCNNSEGYIISSKESLSF